MTIKNAWLIVSFLLISNLSFGQELLPEDLKSICQTWGLTFPEHQDKGIEIHLGPKQFNQQFDVLVLDKKENYSVMTFFVPHSTYNGEENAAVRSMMKATHFASNAEDSHIAMHSLSAAYIRNDFGADWGAVYYFKPKKVLSLKSECQMVVLERAGRGIFYTLYFFEKISEDIEDLKWCPRYVNREQ